MGAAGKVLGVDPGTVRVGVAVSDSGGVLALPLTTLPAGADLAGRLLGLAREQGCETVVIGLPKGMSGRDTTATQSARALAASLRELGVEVELWDERLSSAEAERLLVQAGRRRAQRRAERDRQAATIILQGWLDAAAAARGNRTT